VNRKLAKLEKAHGDVKKIAKDASTRVIRPIDKSLEQWQNIWVFTEIQDHERVLEGSLELLTKGRELATKLNQKLVAIVFGIDIEQYLPIIASYGPDLIIYSNDPKLKHYNGEIFPDMWTDLIKQYKPSIILFPSTESGRDLAPRLAWRFKTGATAHCCELDIIDSQDYKVKLLLMKRPAFSGNLLASILCPYTRPQIATVQQGIFQSVPVLEGSRKKPEILQITCTHELTKLKIVQVQPPTRYHRVNIPLDNSPVVLVGGQGLRSKDNFKKLFELASYLNAEVGATRVAIFNKWCEEDRLIGQTGKVIHPDLYIAFGVSGQIQHTSAISDAKRIISINNDPEAPINEISDYIITEDATLFLNTLIERIKQDKSPVKGS
jgi:electron transfer flavoprotein alpha subunit